MILKAIPWYMPVNLIQIKTTSREVIMGNKNYLKMWIPWIILKRAIRFRWIVTSCSCLAAIPTLKMMTWVAILLFRSLETCPQTTPSKLSSIINRDTMVLVLRTVSRINLIIQRQTKLFWRPRASNPWTLLKSVLSNTKMKWCPSRIFCTRTSD